MDLRKLLLWYLRKRVKLLAVLFALFGIALVINNYIPELVILDIRGYLFYVFGVHTDTMVYVNEEYHVLHYNGPSMKYLINNPDKCLTVVPYIIIFVKTHPKHFEERRVIRETWGDLSTWEGVPSDKQPIVLFMLGLDIDHNHVLQNRLVEENKQHQDIIQENFVEDFHNLTIKLVSHLKWPVLHCRKAKYWMTTDDDVFVNVRNLVSYLSHLKEESVYVGLVHAGSASNKDVNSKYYVPGGIYRGTYYPRYCPGAGYVVSMNVVEKLYKKAQLIPLLYIDDAYAGILANAIGVVPSHYVMFLGEKRTSKDLCTFSMFITSHGHKGNDMYKMLWEVRNLSAVDPNIVCWSTLLSWMNTNDIVYF